MLFSIYAVSSIGRFFYKLFRPLPVAPDDSDLTPHFPPPEPYSKQVIDEDMITTWM